jgi:hypothetical protein
MTRFTEAEGEAIPKNLIAVLTRLHAIDPSKAKAFEARLFEDERIKRYHSIFGPDPEADRHAEEIVEELDDKAKAAIKVMTDRIPNLKKEPPSDFCRSYTAAELGKMLRPFIKVESTRQTVMDWIARKLPSCLHDHARTGDYCRAACFDAFEAMKELAAEVEAEIQKRVPS